MDNSEHRGFLLLLSQNYTRPKKMDFWTLGISIHQASRIINSEAETAPET